MKRIAKWFTVIIMAILFAIATYAASSPIDTSELETVYVNDFESASDIDDFKQINGTFETRGGRLWLKTTGDASNSLLIYDGYGTYDHLVNYVLDVDMYNIQTQAGVVVRSQCGKVASNETLGGNNFYGYFAYISYDGTMGAIGYGTSEGTWGGVLTSGESVLSPGMNVHLQVAVEGNTISYFITDLESGKLMYSTSVTHDAWSKGSFGFRFSNNIKDGLDNLGRTSFDNLRISLLKNEIEIEAGRKTAFVNGKPTSLWTRPEVRNGVIVMPLDLIRDALDGYVYLDGDTYILKLNGKSMRLKMDEAEASINNKFFDLPTAPYEYDGISYFPVGVMLEKFGYTVDWDMEKGTLRASFDEKPAATGDNVASATSGFYEYKVENGKATITKYTGKENEVSIPSSLGGYPVVKIGWEAFYGNSKLKVLSIPSSVTEIDERAFADCACLYTVNFSEGLLSIGVEAFKMCFSAYSNKKSDLDLPESVRYISSYAFSGCSDIKTVDLPDNLLTLGNTAFYECHDLVTVILPDGLRYIGACVFESWRPLLKYVYIPSSVEEIYHSAFFSRPEDYVGMSLKKVYYGGSAEDFLSVKFGDGNLEVINKEKVFGASAYTFVTNGGSSISPVLQKEALNASPVCERVGYNFCGWYDNASLSGDAIEFPYNAGGSVTLYAAWELDADFDGNGSVGVSDALIAIRDLVNGAGAEKDVNGDGRLSLSDIIEILKNI